MSATYEKECGTMICKSGNLLDRNDGVSSAKSNPSDCWRGDSLSKNRRLLFEKAGVFVLSGALRGDMKSAHCAKKGAEEHEVCKTGSGRISFAKTKKTWFADLW